MKILVCEDDIRLNQQICSMLEKNGMETQPCYSVEQLRREMGRKIDLYLLDVHLGDGSVFPLISEIRALRETPVLLLSADLEESSILEGYRYEAEEYIEKPVRPRVLLAKILSVANRCGLIRQKVRYGEYELDPDQNALSGKGRSILLNRSESLLLEKMMKAGGKIIHKEVLKNCLSDSCTDGALRVRLSELRNDLPSDLRIESVRNQGYRLVGREESEGR